MDKKKNYSLIKLVDNLSINKLYNLLILLHLEKKKINDTLIREWEF